MSDNECDVKGQRDRGHHKDVANLRAERPSNRRPRLRQVPPRLEFDGKDYTHVVGFTP